MRQRVSVRLGGKTHYPQLIGAFILIVALLMFLQAGAQMFDSWQAIKDFPNCVSQIRGADTVAQLQFMDCKDSLFNATGIQLQANATKLTVRQSWIAVLGPIAHVLFWAAIFVFGSLIYLSGKLEISFVRSIYDIPERKFAERKFLDLKKKKR